MQLRPTPPLQRQRGAVLFFAIIVLVATTLAGLALTRSVDTSNLIAGNLAFQQSTTQLANAGIEQAVDWLETASSDATNPLYKDAVASGYKADGLNPAQLPAAGVSWESFWNSTLKNQSALAKFDCDSPHLPGSDGGCVDDAGNASALTATGTTVSYAIQRLCTGAGSPPMTGRGATNCPCAENSDGSAKSGLFGPTLACPGNHLYYRVTVRVAGPRNTVSFVQAYIVRPTP